nr:hypothetical protein [Thermoanaerobaculales bacterium]
MPSRRTWTLFAIALGLRLLVWGWDAGVPGSSLHPDERQVGYVTERLDSWFDDPGFFAYGSLHFQAIRAIASVLRLESGSSGLISAGRALSLLSSMLVLALGWLLADRAWGRRTADLFLLLAAWVPLDLQQSHFATVEAHHTAWIVLALAASFWLATAGGGPAAAVAGAAVGASLAVKVASLALGLPLAIALLLAARTRGPVELGRLAALAFASGATVFWICQPWAFAEGRPPAVLIASTAAAAAALGAAAGRSRGLRSALIILGCLSLVIGLVQAAGLVGLAGDGAFGRVIGAGVVDPGPNPAYLAGVDEQVRMVMGEADLPYVRVFVSTLPVLYPLRELSLWGWGPLLVLAVFAAVAAGVVRLARRWRRLVAGPWAASSIL